MKTLELSNDRNTKADFARLKSVLACAAKDEARHVITKVLVENDGEGIAVIATDGKRLRSDRFGMEAEPGIYDIKLNSAKAVFLTQCTEELTFPNYRQVIPSAGAEQAYTLEGTGKQFVLWATAGLGCLIDPKLVELGEDEAVTLYIQKGDPVRAPVLVRNDTTTLVVMPMRLDQPWIRELETIQTERVVKILEEQKAEALAA